MASIVNDVIGFIFPENASGVSLVDPLAGGFELDIVEQEDHTLPREVTDNPVENGSPTGDHIIKLPREYSFTGMVSNAPIKNLLEIAEDVVANGFFSDEDATGQAFAKLEALYESSELITIYTRYALYENMAITSINVPRRVEDGDAITISISAKQIRVVTTKTTQVPAGVGIAKQNTTAPGTGKGKAGMSNSTDPATANRATPTKDLGNNKGSIAYQAGQGFEKVSGKLKDKIAEWGFNL